VCGPVCNGDDRCGVAAVAGCARDVFVVSCVA
jgi:hypothetical protein